MENPWVKVSLNNYEQHMKLADIQQLQTLNQIMKQQIKQHQIKTIAILGIAGGNGLEHIDT
ncbi:MAG: methyltransferase type 11, partial [Oscillospiraceae bacterium]